MNLRKDRAGSSEVLALLLAIVLIGISFDSAAAAPPTTNQAQRKTPRPPATSEPVNRDRKLPIEARVLARKASTAVGLVLVRNSTDIAGQEPRPRGSGVVVRKDGIIATNYHVIARDNSDAVYDELVFRLSDPFPRAYRVNVRLVNRSLDLALLQVASPKSPVSLPAVELGDSRTVQLLDDLVIIGYPEKGGTSVTVNTGFVEGKDDNWIKTDARLIHGNSGGAAIDSSGRLVGIPTKVVVDTDRTRSLGAVGFLRPVNLVAAMLRELESNRSLASGTTPPNHPAPPPQTNPGGDAKLSIVVRGVVRSKNGSAIAGARVGLVPLGSPNVTAENLLSWGGTNAEGRFELNRPVPPGRYTVRVRALGYDPHTIDITIGEKPSELLIELNAVP